MRLLNIISPKKDRRVYFLLSVLVINFFLIPTNGVNLNAALADPCAPYGCAYNGPCAGQSNESEPTCGLYVIWSKSASCGMWRSVYTVNLPYPNSTTYCNYWN
jgi:hypothetical protein